MFEQLGKQALRQARMVKVMTTSGVIRPYGPVTLARRRQDDPRLGDRLRRRHRCPGDPVARSDVGLVDELGELTWAELDERSTRLAHGLRGPRGRPRATASPCCAATTATSWTSPPPCPSSARTSST